MLLIVFREMGWWSAAPASVTEMFEKVSNRQLQVASVVSCLWAAALAARTHTVALSSGFTLLLVTFSLTVLGDYGLERWLEEGLWDQLSFHLLPVLVVTAALGAWADRKARHWFAEPLYFAAAGLFVLVFELLAQGG